MSENATNQQVVIPETLKAANTFIANRSHGVLALEPSAMVEMASRIEVLLKDTQKAELLVPKISACFGDFEWLEPDSWMAAYQPYNVTEEGILTIPVTGMLLDDFPYAIEGYATGYPYIVAAVERGANDANVRGILLVVNSGGGVVDDLPECAEIIANVGKTKPIATYASYMCSAAYYLGCQASAGVAVSRSAMVGSIGVVCTHVEYSGALAQAGITVSYVYAGAHKIDGNSTQPLSNDARTTLQGFVNENYEDFVSAVSAARNIPVTEVRATEAQIYSANDAVENKLVDTVATPQQAVAAFLSHLQIQETQVSAENQAAIDAAVTVARTEAAAAERARIGAIMALPEAEARMGLATHIAMSTSMSVDDAKPMLAAAPKEAPVATPDPAAPSAPMQAASGTQVPFVQAMVETGNPNVGAELSHSNQAVAEKPNRAASALDSVFGPRK